MRAARVDVLVWVLIFGGLLVAGLGLAVQRADDVLGWVIVVVGAVLAAAGAVLVWVRSRMAPGDGA
jgi:hypothetical protein